jgi:hypothetical protein
MDEQQPPLLLQLPDPCLLEVLHCLVDDPSSLCSAARAHSRLHQAAVVRLNSISASVKTQQQLGTSLLPYLTKHGQHVGHIILEGPGSHETVSLRQLASMSTLTSLACSNLGLQLQARDGFQGVLGAAGLPLKQLQLEHCALLDGAQGLAAALSLLPGLEQLSACWLRSKRFHFPTEVLQQLPQLTSLKLAGFRLQSRPGQANCDLTPLQSLTRLVELDLSFVSKVTVAAGALSSLCCLTCLRLSVSNDVEPGVLAGKTRLQHLQLESCSIAGGAVGVAQLLSQLQHLQQLTHLTLACSLVTVDEDNPPAAAYSALTASSTLQRLDVCGCTMPVGVWQHIFPAGRQLPRLQSLNVSSVRQPDGDQSAAPDGDRLVGCCPGLQDLEMRFLPCNAQQLAPLSRLSGLTALILCLSDGPWLGRATQYVGQLTGLRELAVRMPEATEAEGLMLQLAQLQQLTVLECWMSGALFAVVFESKVR